MGRDRPPYRNPSELHTFFQNAASATVTATSSWRVRVEVRISRTASLGIKLSSSLGFDQRREASAQWKRRLRVLIRSLAKPFHVRRCCFYDQVDSFGGTLDLTRFLHESPFVAIDHLLDHAGR